MKSSITEERGTPSWDLQRFFASVKRKRELLALSLFALTLLLYGPTSHFEFTNYDDPQYVTENPHVHMGLHWSTVVWSFTDSLVPDAHLKFLQWHPLTWISYLIDFELFRQNPAGYHFMNVVYHAVAVVLLFLVLSWGTGYMGRSFWVAVLFAFHPLNVQSVAWISERKNVLSAIFWILSIWAYGWYALRPGWRRYLTLLVCFALGIMSKATVTTLPCVLLLLDIWPFGRLEASPYLSYPSKQCLNTELRFDRKRWPRLVLEKIPLLILSAAGTVLAFLAKRGVVSPSHPLTARIENAVVAFVLYIGKAFLPFHLAAIYPAPSYNTPVWKLALCSMFLVGVTTLTWRLRHSRPYLLVGWLYFLGTLIPVIGVFQNGEWELADRHAYIPLIGIFVALVWTITDWAERSRMRRFVALALSGLLLAVLMADLRYELSYWHDSISLFSRAVSVTEGNDLAETNLGEALAGKGRVEEAAIHFVNAVRYKPDNSSYRYNYGRSLLSAHKPQEAIEQLNLAVSLEGPAPVRARAYRDLGAAYVQVRKKREAESSYENAIHLDPEDAQSYLALGLLELEHDKFDAASTHLQESVRLQPSDIGFFALGQILERQGRLLEAQAAYEKAVAITPSLPDFHRSLDAIHDKIKSQKSSTEPAAPRRR